MAAPEAPLLYQGVSRSSAAFRLLKQMGWEEGEGLGKEKQGIKQHVRVAKKIDNSGVGIDAQQKAASNWAFNTTTFDNILKNLNVIVADKIEEGDDTEPDEPVEHWKHTKSVPSRKATRPQGRYKKREFGKVLEGKSKVDLDAILGFGSKLSREVWPVPDVSKATIIDHFPESSCIPSERLAEVNDAIPALHSSAIIKPEQVMEEMPAINIPSDWWGTKHGFVPAGTLGHDAKNRNETTDLQANSLTKGRMTFCEQDQEDLYKLVQDKATKGKQGLGIADRPKKIGGANWKGQKVILDNSDDDAESEEVLDVLKKCPGSSEDMACETGQDCKRKANSDWEDVKDIKKQRADNKLKWKKLSKRLLQEAPDQTMKIKDLQKLILEESYLSTGGQLDSSKQPAYLTKEKLKEKLMKSSSFVIEGKKISLATLS